MIKNEGVLTYIPVVMEVRNFRECILGRVSDKNSKLL